MNWEAIGAAGGDGGAGDAGVLTLGGPPLMW